jgi:hypothetical protein
MTHSLSENVNDEDGKGSKNPTEGWDYRHVLRIPALRRLRLAWAVQ